MCIRDRCRVIGYNICRVKTETEKEHNMKNTKITVTVTYEMEYDGEVTEEDIDINDIIDDKDAIIDMKVKTKKVKGE